MTRVSHVDSVLYISASTGPILIGPSSIALYWFYQSPGGGLARLRACSKISQRVDDIYSAATAVNPWATFVMLKL